MTVQWLVDCCDCCCRYNFNHERWMIVQNLLGLARAAFADAICWAKQRKVFGKSLVQQPVIRNKLGD